MNYTDFILRFPEFADVPQAQAEFQLNLSAKLLKKSAWGKFYDDAIALHTAHYLAIRYNISSALASNGVNDPRASIGTANNMSASTSSLSEGMALNGMLTSNSPITADFARTEYGLQYLNLLYSVIAPGFLAV